MTIMVIPVSHGNSSGNSSGNDIPDKIESQGKFYWNLVAEITFEKDLKRCIVHMKRCTLEEEFVYPTKWSSWEKVF